MLAIRYPQRHETRLAFLWRRWRLLHRFRREVGIAGNFEQPRTYEEKAKFRKLYGNHQCYALMADKYRVREFVADRVGRQHLVSLLGVYDRITAKTFADLPVASS